MICDNCKKEFSSIRIKKYCSTKCSYEKTYERHKIKRKEQKKYPNAKQVDKIIYNHNSCVVNQNNDWVFSEAISDWCSSRNSYYRIKDRDRYRNRKKKK